jgi:outer membrane assembly lipoprotein YfiO
MRIMSRSWWFVAVIALQACSHRLTPPRVSLNPLNASPKMLDSLWTAAMDHYQHHKWDKAAAAFDRLELELPPGDRRTLLSRLYLGELYVRSGSNLQGVREYRRLVDEFPTDSLAPEALLRAGEAYAKLWRAPDLDPTYGITAQSVFTEVQTRYPASPAAAQARERLKQLDNKFAAKDYKIGTYYLKYRAYESAILMLKGLIVDHSHAAVVPSALADLVKVYRKLGYVEDIKVVCTFVGLDWSTTPQYQQSCVDSPPTAAEKSSGP